MKLSEIRNNINSLADDIILTLGDNIEDIIAGSDTPEDSDIELHERCLLYGKLRLTEETIKAKNKNRKKLKPQICVEKEIYNILPSDIDLPFDSFHVEKINREEECDILYRDLVDKMYLLGWDIEVNDWDYLGFLTGSTKGVAYKKEQEQFKSDMAKIINELLNNSNP